MWSGNFRDLSASVTRLATLAEPPRVSTGLAEAEIARLRWLWAAQSAPQPEGAFDLAQHFGSRFDTLDSFDRMQLQSVLAVCQRARSLADAGRSLFDQSRLQRESPNDSDRLRKYLLKFGLSWADVLLTQS